MGAIGQAADRRTEALEELRDMKSRQLSGEASEEEVEAATQVYREAYEKVESLRTVIPGVARIPPPPADTLSRDRMQDNAAAAQQFLGIDAEDVAKPPPETDRREGLAPPLLAVLALVVVSQIMLLGFLSVDPMSANSALDTIGSAIDR